MPLHIVIVSLIATSLLMGCVSLLQDATAYLRRTHAQRRNSPPAPEYPHPILLEYPTPGPALQPRFVPVTRTRAKLAGDGGRVGAWQEADSRRRA
jgi:hypothetical protein